MKGPLADGVECTARTPDEVGAVEGPGHHWAAAVMDRDAGAGRASAVRRSHFSDIPLHLDGQAKVKVTVEQRASGDGLVTVRPLHGRRAYTLPLAVVAEIIAFKVAKAEALERVRRGLR